MVQGQQLLFGLTMLSIDFKNHDLILTNGSAIGILAENVQEIEILNDKIIQTVPHTPGVFDNYGIKLINVKNIHVDNVYINGPRGSIHVNNSEFIRIENSMFERNLGPNIELHSANSAFIRYCTFTNSQFFGITVSSGFPTPGFEISKNIMIEHVSFNGYGGAIVLTGTDGVMITDVNISVVPVSPNKSFGFFIAASQDAGADPAPVNNVTIRDSTFYAENIDTGGDGIWLSNGNNALLQNLIIRVNSQPESITDIEGAIHIGDTTGDVATTYNNVKIMNVVISGGSHDAIAIDNGKNITFDNVVISESQFAGIHIYPDSSEVTVKNSDIKNNVNGVIIDTGSEDNTIIDNVINKNTSIGVLINGNKNQIINNIVINNGTNIDNNGTDNILSGNVTN